MLLLMAIILQIVSRIYNNYVLFISCLKDKKYKQNKIFSMSYISEINKL